MKNNKKSILNKAFIVMIIFISLFLSSCSLSSIISNWLSGASGDSSVNLKQIGEGKVLYDSDNKILIFTNDSLVQESNELQDVGGYGANTIIIKKKGDKEVIYRDGNNKIIAFYNINVCDTLSQNYISDCYSTKLDNKPISIFYNSKGKDVVLRTDLENIDNSQIEEETLSPDNTCKEILGNDARSAINDKCDYNLCSRHTCNYVNNDLNFNNNQAECNIHCVFNGDDQQINKDYKILITKTDSGYTFECSRTQ